MCRFLGHIAGCICFGNTWRVWLHGLICVVPREYPPKRIEKL
jgi:hypothetical protein